MALPTEEVDQIPPTKLDMSFEALFEGSPPSDNNDEGIYEPEDSRKWNLPVPFSALTQTMRPNMRPRRHIRRFSSSFSSEDAEQNSFLEESAEPDLRHDKLLRSASRPSCITDEFGFKIDLTESGLPMTPFIDSVDSRRNWLVCLEFSYTNRLGVPEELGELDNGMLSQEESLWSRIVPQITPSPRLTELIRGIPDPRAKAPVWIGISRDDAEGPSLKGNGGIPHCFRSKIWPRLSGAFEKQKQAASQQPSLTYADLVHCSSSLSPHTVNQIEKDLLRTMPNNICFCSAASVGVPRLKRLLLAIAWLYTDVGYCQGLGVIAANLLLFMEEEAAFWMMCSIIEDILPPSYFSADSLIGVQADQRVLGELISVFMPRLKAVIQEHEVDLALITLGWFLTLFSGVLPMRIMLRVWDLLFYEGSTVLFRVALAILKLNEEVLINTKNTASFFNTVSAAPASITNVAELCQVAYSFEEEYLDQTYIDGLRRHHLSQLLVEISSSQCPAPVKPLPKQFLSKRNIKSRPGLFCGFFNGDTHASEPQNELFSVLDSPTSFSFSSGLQEVIGSALCLSGADRLVGDRHIRYYSHFSDLDSADPKIKNIRQTELLINLRQAILAIVRHFHSNDPSHSKISAQPDYSLASHGKDLAVYVQTAAVQTRRAKALEDFARQETDELGFRRNDIITVLDMHDEHCWLGELNNLRGWFPAKLVELLDERSKRYSPAGDDTVYASIGHLVRHGLCSALRAIFEYGLKRTRGLTDTSSHPWKFVEEVAAAEAARDSSSIHSRLILCRTYRLDEVGKVLSPEELLYRSIRSINASHDCPGVTDDVKFHTLICIGLNELVLHLWLEILCSCEEVVTRRYHPWSFLRSPGWVQIKCELRVLSQFAFHLYPLWEINDRSGSSKALATYEHKSFHKAKLPLRLLSKLHLGVRPLDPSDSCDFGAFKRDTESTGDMLVKYHLFSWEL